MNRTLKDKPTQYDERHDKMIFQHDNGRPILLEPTEPTTEVTQILSTSTDPPTTLASTTPQNACEGVQCEFDATCEVGSGGPVCRCLFDCPRGPSSEDYFPVCASDRRLYSSMCAMRQAACERRTPLRLRPLELCKDTARTDDTVAPPGCEASEHGCCPDMKTPAGLNRTGCPRQCSCNRLGSVSDTCEETTGQCQCRPGVGGIKCDRCEPGYWGLPKIHSGYSGCIPCGCSMFGSVREDCEQMTGRCVCKSGVQGQKCTICTNHNDVLGPNGCYNANTGVAVRFSCSDLVCYFGAVCIEKEGRALCQCPAASCPTDTTYGPLVVCGSDSKTYPSECHLKLQACRTQEDIVVQAFGSCQSMGNPFGTALPPRQYSPLQFTQQDELSPLSKSTRHLLVLDTKHSYKYDLKRKEGIGDFDTGSSTVIRGINRPTPATVGALLGDLCTVNEDCAELPGTHCHSGACKCLENYIATLNRKGCIDGYNPCISSPCNNFGTCVDETATKYQCICSPPFTGPNCDDLMDLEMQKSIDVPSFNGTSYIKMKPLKAYHKLNIDIELKSFSNNGIIVYNQHTVDGNGDFVSIAIVNGYVVFKYNLGDGIVTLKSPEKISLNTYHKISAKRYYRDGILSVDEMETVVGQSTGSLKALDLFDDCYIGNIPTNYSKVFKNIGTHIGFKGCIKHLRLIRHYVTKKLSHIDPTILALENIKECHNNPCMNMPCHNGGQCIRTTESSMEYTCQCEKGFSGYHCEERYDPCESNPCKKGEICNIGANGHYKCQCLYGSDGASCKSDVSASQETLVAEFDGSSYIQLPKMTELEKEFIIEIWFLTRKLNGVLLYSGQSSKTKDFFTVNLVNGFMQYRYNLGSGIANITLSQRVQKDWWHKLRITRSDRHGTIQLDELPARKGHSIPPLTKLNVEIPLFIGSLPTYIKTHKLSGVSRSFMGAIQRIFLNGSPVMLYTKDMARCKIIPTERVTHCATQGIKAYSGLPCSESRSPCRNGATCVPLLNDFKCLCKKPYGGKHCDMRVDGENDKNNVPPIESNLNEAGDSRRRLYKSADSGSFLHYLRNYYEDLTS